MRPSATRHGAAQQGARAVPHGGPVDTGSFQKNGLLTCPGRRYPARHTPGRGALVARRAHGGFCHAEFAAGPLDHPASTAWTGSASGAAGTALDGPAPAPRFTCPRCVTTPEGRLRPGRRFRVPGSIGRNVRAGYGGSRWTEPGEGTGTHTAEHGAGTAPFTGSAGRPQSAIGRVTDRSGRRGTHDGAGRSAHGRALHLCETASAGRRTTGTPVPLRSGQRTKFVLDRYDNACAVLPFDRSPQPRGPGQRPFVPVPEGVRRHDAPGVARDRLRPAGVTVM
ncbi:hypothetical protein [Streptomyces sp. NPDC047841]|uniref:hypothetical protein n=1 Tax=Streptomyces sp. NPDC047841 TaxID=3154708 RepID=UPI003454C24E